MPESRGLLNLRTTPDALPAMPGEEERGYADVGTGFIPEAEIQARYEIILENYCKTVNIEALTMVDMARKEILPAVAAYEKDLADTLEEKLKMLPELTGRYERRTIAKLSGIVDEIDAAAEELDSAAIRLKTINDVAEASYYIRDVILHKMAELRVVCDEARCLRLRSTGHFPHTKSYCSE